MSTETSKEKTRAEHAKAAFAKAHAPSPSVALMRKSVRQPGPSLKRRIKAHGSTDHLIKKHALEARPLISDIAKRRPPASAHQVKKSPLITHFSPLPPSRIEPAASAASSAGASVHHLAPAPKPLPSRHAAVHQPHSRTTADILERALEQAVSHDQPPHKLSKKKRGRLAGTWLAAAAVLLVLSVGISQNLTNLQLQFASAKAGFSASLPKNLPSGYSLNKLEYASGTVATNFQSNSSRQAYAIIQRTSSWDSQALENSYVAPSDPRYQVVATAGLTVYIFGNHNATWVNNGIWYTIQSNGTLSDHELVNMASST